MQQSWIALGFSCHIIRSPSAISTLMLRLLMSIVANESLVGSVTTGVVVVSTRRGWVMIYTCVRASTGRRGIVSRVVRGIFSGRIIGFPR